jgi:hypothetical protein
MGMQLPKISQEEFYFLLDFNTIFAIIDLIGNAASQTKLG